MQRIPVIGQAFPQSTVEAVQRAAIEASGLELAIEHWERRDLVLNNAATPLMREARAHRGLANGQGAFLAGSEDTFRLITGQEPPADVMRAALATELGLPEDGLAVVGD